METDERVYAGDPSDSTGPDKAKKGCPENIFYRMVFSANEKVFLPATII